MGKIGWPDYKILPKEYRTPRPCSCNVMLFGYKDGISDENKKQGKNIPRIRDRMYRALVVGSPVLCDALPRENWTEMRGHYVSIT